ncbi:MAG: DegV family protein, partial [Ruminococcus sp.]|nr:DegV family protein [Ruminococcus sp.]
MENKVMLFADSTIDLTQELRERYSINTVPIHIILNDKTYMDGE